jgi:histidyl-tRNA synthetase
MATSLDKLEKIGIERVKEEMILNGIEDPDLVFEKLESINDVINDNVKYGLDEVSKVIKYVDSLGIDVDNIEFDPTLARGLNYYTGCIFEVKINGVSIGSVGGGGRYDELTSLFGWEGVSGVGFSFGLDRLCDCLEELNLFPKFKEDNYLVLNFGDEDYCIEVLKDLRGKGIKSQIFPDRSKIQKQMKWANENNFSYVIICGEREKENSEYIIKDMSTGEQKKVNKET